MGVCHSCNRKFSDRDYQNAAKGMLGDRCLVGDWDWICYPCQLKMIDNNTWDSFRDKMLEEHNGSGQCQHNE